MQKEHIIIILIYYSFSYSYKCKVLIMNNPNVVHKEHQGSLPQQRDLINPLIIGSLLKDYWYYFLLAIIASFFCARFYIRHTMRVYQTSVTLLINDTGERGAMDNSELLQGLGLPAGMRNLQNQIMILQSRALTENTLKELSFETEYYFKTIKNQLPIYPDTPIRIKYNNENQPPKDVEFLITFLDSNKFILESKADDYPLKKSASFGETIKILSGSLIIECQDEEWFKENSDRLLNFKRRLYFTIHSSNSLINYFKNRLNIEQVSKDGSVLRISMDGTNRNKDVDFLNKFVENFQLISLGKKNSEAERRIDFIDNQLIGVSDSLSLTENRLQQFRSTNKVMDLSAQGQSIIGQVTLLENERARLDLEASYYDYLADYLSKNISGEAPIVPITMGINDARLTSLVNELAEIQSQLSGMGAGGLNPLQKNLEQRVLNTKDALRETLNGLRRANSLARSENQQRINRANAQASALPVTERQLLGIERKFRINNELYTFLLEKRAELHMQKASNNADSEVIDPADERFSTLVSPIPIKVYSVGIGLGILIVGVILFLKSLFSKTLKEDEIRNMTEIPVVGNIPHNSEKTIKILLDYPNLIVSEAFRLLRSRMQFFTKEAISPVILVTSAMPGDGKTFIALNLASAYSLLGKKTILIGFDLRRPKIYQDFSLSNESGVSTWLIGQDSLENVIQKTSFENLSIIPAGPIPPNPSELTELDKTEELFKLLKERYEYVIVDSSPIGFVSDTLHLAALADTSIFVVRPEKTMRNIIDNTLNVINTSGIKSVCLVINDIKSSSKHYGYNGKYGYGEDKLKSKKGIFKSNKFEST